MKVKYTPGTPDGLVGKTFNVEIVSLNMVKIPFINEPVLKSVKIKYEDGRSEWVDAMKFYSDVRDNKSIVRYTY
jgi:hypothetical protein